MTGDKAMWLSRIAVASLAALLPLSFAVAGGDSIEARAGELMQQAKQMEVRMPKFDPEGKDAARDLMRQYQSPEFQRELQKERLRLAETFFGQKTAEDIHKESKPDQGGVLPPGGRIYIFVSSSMPLNALRNYAADMERLGDQVVVMVLRGFVGGAKRIGPTARLAGEVLKTRPACDLASGGCSLRNLSFIVDPILFRKFGISQVPAVVFAPATNEAEAMIAYGDASLGYILELFAREGAGKKLAGVAERLRGRSSPWPD